MNRRKCISAFLLFAAFPFAQMTATAATAEVPAPIVHEVQQSIRIKGRVTDVNGEAIIGASVVEKGTTNGIVTDLDGNFELQAGQNAKLVVSYVGYKTLEVTATANKTMNISLREDTELLDELVVVGYGAVKKSDLTGAVASVSTEQLVRGGKTDAVGAMQGVLPGVQIQRSDNRPGGSYSILIRGMNTISGDTSPLIVVDGVPGAALENINPDDIEKIDILKDASSTAIYGSRASNGVVMVTTKRGNSGKVKVEYSGYAGFRNHTHMPNMMSGEEYVQLAREAARAQNDNVYQDDSNIFTASELKAIADGNYFDWVDAISTGSAMTNHTISATGGNEYSTYALSAGYYFEDGIIEPEDYSRYNVRASLDVKPNKYLNFGVNMYGTHSVRDAGNADLLQDAFRLRPTYHPTNLVTGEEEWSYSNGQYNALITGPNVHQKTKTFNFFSNIYLAINPIKNVTLKTTFSPNITFTEFGQYRGKYTKANKGTNNATSYYTTTTDTDWVWDNQVSYNFQKGDHRFDVMGVFSMQQAMEEYLYGLGNYLTFNSLWYNVQGGTTNSSKSTYEKTSLMSYLARANYVYKDRYYATASIRYDGSSKLAEGNKWGSFTALALAWRISGENFMKEVSWVDNLKLRLGYGQSGNDNVSAYQTQGSISSATYYSFGSTNTIGYLPGALQNKELGWERTTEYNIGLDFAVLNSRISGTIEYYNRLTDDLIMSKTVPVTTGYTSVTANVGSVRNKGIEVSLHTENIQTKNFTWSTNINFAYNKNAIVDLQYKEDLSSRGVSMEGMYGDYSNLWIIGQPIDVNYDIKTLGVWQLDEETEAAVYGCKPGQYKPQDLNGDGTIDDEDRFFNSKRTPDLTGGMTNTFTYKGFDLSTQFAFQAGAISRNQFYVSYALENNNQNFNNLRKDYWTPENPTNSSAQPSNMGTYRDKAGTWGSTKSAMTHTRSKSDYFKIPFVTLGYTFKQSMIDKLYLSRLRVYATVQNPLILCGKDVVDPEHLTTSIGATDVITRNVMFGLSLAFK